MPDLSGTTIDRYHLIEKLGEGGMAIVYKAFDTHLETEVALKIIRKGTFGEEVFQRFSLRFKREANTLAKLDHPNVVKVTDFGEYGDIPYLVMPYLSGGTLKARMGKPMPFEEAATLLLPILEALAYAHSREVVHRDVKPANILFSASGEPMLTDFGIAKILDLEEGMTLTGTGVGLGTPEYMAPEQWTGSSSPSVDIYSAGVILYEMLTGRKPYSADTPAAVLLMQANDPLPRPSKLVSTISPTVENLLFKALAKRPEDRYRDIREFIAAVQRVLSLPAEDLTGQTMDYFDARGVDLPDQSIQRNGSGGKRKTGFMKKAWLWIPFGLLVLAGVVLLVIRLQSTFTGDGLGTLTTSVLSKPLSFESPAASGTLDPKSQATSTLPVITPTIKTTSLPKPGATRVSKKDGMTMVYVPEGTFKMGVPLEITGDDIDADEKPQHDVYLSAYWIDQTEVTNTMFQQFIDSTGYQTTSEKTGFSYYYKIDEKVKLFGANWMHPQGPSSSLEGLTQHPVINVSWDDAFAYCAWAGRRLPTEAEWEKAAHGLAYSKFPWGNGFYCNKGNFDDEKTIDTYTVDTYNCDSYPRTAPVGVFSAGASPYGVLDLSGNVWEWTADWYGQGYYQTSPKNDPKGPDSGDGRAIRGGSWYTELGFLRTTYRDMEPEYYSSDSLGFRCAKDG